MNQPLQQSQSLPITSSKSLDFDAEQQVKRAFEENPNAGITLLFRLYYSALCSHALRFVSSKAIAEDLVSDLFYEFHSQERYLKIDNSYRAYLFAATRHRAFDYIRREMTRQTSLDQAANVYTQEGESPDSITQYEDLYNDIQQAIRNMPFKRQQIYLMNRFEGKKAIEIAEELAVSARTVEAHLYQAFRQLRNTLKDKWLF